MPGLIRGMARTAAVVGTAQATRNAVNRHSAEKDAKAYSDAMQAAQMPPPQQYAPPPQQYAPPPEAAPNPIEGFNWVWLGLAVVLDIASYTGGGYGNRNRIPGYKK